MTIHDTIAQIEALRNTAMDVHRSEYAERDYLVSLSNAVPSLIAYIRALEKVRDLVSDEAFSPDVTTPFNRESQMFRDYWIDGTRVTDIREAVAAAREAGK